MAWYLNLPFRPCTTIFIVSSRVLFLPSSEMLLSGILAVFQASSDPSMSRMVRLMNLDGVSCADLCSAMTSKTSASQLIMATAHAHVSACRDLTAQASIVKAAASCLQDLSLNLLELTIVAPLISRKRRGAHNLFSSVGVAQDSVSQTDQPSSSCLSLSSMESCDSIEQIFSSEQLRDTTSSGSHNDSLPDKNMAADVFCCLQQLLRHR